MGAGAEALAVRHDFDRDRGLGGAGEDQRAVGGGLRAEVDVLVGGGGGAGDDQGLLLVRRGARQLVRVAGLDGVAQVGRQRVVPGLAVGRAALGGGAALAAIRQAAAGQRAGALAGPDVREGEEAAAAGRFGRADALRLGPLVVIAPVAAVVGFAVFVVVVG